MKEENYRKNFSILPHTLQKVALFYCFFNVESVDFGIFWRYFLIQCFPQVAPLDQVLQHFLHLERR